MGRPRTPRSTSWFRGLVVVCGALVGASQRADSVTLAPTADATLLEAAPSNSLGGATFFNAGTTQTYTRNHALLRFDPREKIPPGSTIVSVRLTLEVERRPRDGFASVEMGLHRMLKSWGEGETLPKLPDTSPGLGGAAGTGDATWTHRFHNTTNTWAEPGGAIHVDYAAEPSTATVLFSVEDSPYEFPTTSRLVGDVQHWLDHPLDNHGWMMRPVDERPNFTARRMSSREGNAPPVLFVDFTPPPPPLWMLIITRVSDRSATVRFRQAAGVPCRVEGRDGLDSGTWNVMGEFASGVEETERSVEVDFDSEATYVRVAILPPAGFGGGLPLPLGSR